MPLDLPNGTNCFVDANILYYALVPTAGVSESCVTFLERAIDGHLSLFTSISVVSDAVHKVMISEAAQLVGRDRAGMIGYLGRHPEVIGQLVSIQRH